jgi:hypothetical protein
VSRLELLGGLATIAALLAVSTDLRAQAEPTPVEIEIEDDDGVEAMRSRVFAFVGALAVYTADVRVGEPELEAVLTHYGALDEIHGDDDPGEVVERAFRDGRYDFEIIVNDPSYVGWCRARDLEPEPFFRGLLRLEALRMREEGLEGLEVAREELPEQRAELQSMRQELGEDAYSEGITALEAAAEMVEETRELMSALPQPSQEEVRLLTENRERIRRVLDGE